MVRRRRTDAPAFAAGPAHCDAGTDCGAPRRPRPSRRARFAGHTECAATRARDPPSRGRRWARRPNPNPNPQLVQRLVSDANTRCNPPMPRRAHRLRRGALLACSRTECVRAWYDGDTEGRGVRCPRGRSLSHAAGRIVDTLSCRFSCRAAVATAAARRSSCCVAAGVVGV